jgi:hypothetical protein
MERSFDKNRAIRLVTTGLAAALSLWSANPAAADTVVNCTANPAALQAALANAQLGGTLQISGRCRGTYTIETSLKLIGTGTAVLDGKGRGPVLTIVAGVRVVLDQLVVTGGASVAPTAVGGIANSGDLQVMRSTIIGNSATGGAVAIGGIHSAPGATASLLLSGSTVLDNRATVVTSGPASATGGVRTEGTVAMSKTEVRGNSAFVRSAVANRAFGAMAIGAGQGFIYGAVVRDNTARAEHTGTTGSGLVAGAIAGITHLPSPDELIIGKSVIHGNQAVAVSAVGSGAAGGLLTRMTTVTGTDVSGNTAEAGTFSAGGVVNHDAPMVFENGSIQGNLAFATEPGGLAAGGMVTGYLGPASTALIGSTVVNNRAAGADSVGGLYLVSPNGSYTLEQSKVDMNNPFDCNFACQP